MSESLQEIERLVDAFQAAVVRYTLVAEESGGLEVNATADALLSAITRVVQERAKHRIECNYPNGPIGAGGCICEVVNKNESARRDARIAELEKALKASPCTIDGFDRLVWDCKERDCLRCAALAEAGLA